MHRSEVPSLSPQVESTGHRTRADEVYAALRAGIVSLQFKPGSMIQEESLARQLGVSRTPIREALRRLAQEGLVQTVPKKGTIVAGISLNDIREVFQIRLALEPLATRLAASTVPPDVIERLRSQHTPLPEAANRVDPRHQELHVCIRRYCGNKRLESILELLIVDTNRVLSLSSPEYLRLSALHHQRILDAMQLRDADAAEQAMREHILTAQQMMVSSLFSG